MNNIAYIGKHLVFVLQQLKFVPVYCKSDNLRTNIVIITFKLCWFLLFLPTRRFLSDSLLFFGNIWTFKLCKKESCECDVLLTSATARIKIQQKHSTTNANLENFLFLSLRMKLLFCWMVINRHFALLRTYSKVGRFRYTFLFVIGLWRRARRCSPSQTGKILFWTRIHASKCHWIYQIRIPSSILNS